MRLALSSAANSMVEPLFLLFSSFFYLSFFYPFLPLMQVLHHDSFWSTLIMFLGFTFFQAVALSCAATPMVEPSLLLLFRSMRTLHRRLFLDFHLFPFTFYLSLLTTLDCAARQLFIFEKDIMVPETRRAETNIHR